MPKSPPKIVLASSSPRRKAILSLLKIPFQNVRPLFDETPNNSLSAREEALSFSEGKATSIAGRFKGAIIIESDTLIEFKKKKIGKPENTEAAKTMLDQLQGKSHRIWTAVFMIDTSDGATKSSIRQIDIEMFPMNHEEIDAYIKTGEPLDKAGGYAIQGVGRKFIRTLKGDKLAAIGLPLQPLIDFLFTRKITFPKPILTKVQDESLSLFDPNKNFIE